MFRNRVYPIKIPFTRAYTYNEMSNILVNLFKHNFARLFGRLSTKYLRALDKELLLMHSRHINYSTCARPHVVHPCSGGNTSRYYSILREGSEKRSSDAKRIWFLVMIITVFIKVDLLFQQNRNTGKSHGDFWVSSRRIASQAETDRKRLKYRRYKQWRTQKISGGGNFRHNRVTSQINFRTTIPKGSGGMPPGKFCKITPKNTQITPKITHLHLKIRVLFIHFFIFRV